MIGSYSRTASYHCRLIHLANAALKHLPDLLHPLDPMAHPIYQVESFQIVAPYTLRVQFDDDTQQVIDFQPILAGALYGPLRDLALFNQARIGPEVHTLVWPNGADFDPATLHDWPELASILKARAAAWNLNPT